MSEWQRIETAPKEGRVLLCIVSYDADGSVLRKRVAIGQRGPGDPDWGVEDWPKWAVSDRRMLAAFPSYWMPLPDPPK